MKALQFLWPIALIVISNLFYHICSKSTPDNLNPFASLTVTYLIGAALSALLFFALGRGSSLAAEYRKLNWTSILLGLSIVGLEAGNIYMYKVGWELSTGQLVQSSILAIFLIIVGAVAYREQVTPMKLAGIAVCLIGLFIISKG